MASRARTQSGSLPGRQHLLRTHLQHHRRQDCDADRLGRRAPGQCDGHAGRHQPHREPGPTRSSTRQTAASRLRTMTLTGDGAFTGAYTGPEGTGLPLTGTVNRFGSVNVNDQQRRALAAGRGSGRQRHAGRHRHAADRDRGHGERLDAHLHQTVSPRPALFSNRNASGTDCCIRPAGRVRDRPRRWPRAGAALDRPAAHGPADSGEPCGLFRCSLRWRAGCSSCT